VVVLAALSARSGAGVVGGEAAGTGATLGGTSSSHDGIPCDVVIVGVRAVTSVVGVVACPFRRPATGTDMTVNKKKKKRGVYSICLD
jgi:hypothetical protein